MSTNSATAPHPSQQFLKFLLPPNVNVMLATDRITEILNLNVNQIVPIPQVSSEVIGVSNWRGEVLWLIDLGELLKVEPLHHQNSQAIDYRTLVIHHSNGCLGLVINQVSQTLWCNPVEIQRLSETQRTNQRSRCLQGYWSSSEGETIWVLDCDAVVNVLQGRSG